MKLFLSLSSSSSCFLLIINFFISFLFISQLMILMIVPVDGVDRNKFRKCSDTGFCRRHREHIPETSFYVVPSSLSMIESKGYLSANLVGGPPGTPMLTLEMTVYVDSVVQLKIKEKNPIKERWIPPEILEEENLLPTSYTFEKDENGFSLIYGDGNRGKVSVQNNPFRINVYMDGKHTMAINDDNMMYFEHYRDQDGIPQTAHIDIEGLNDEVDRHNGKEIVGYWEDGLAIYADGSREEKKTDTHNEQHSADDDSDGYWSESFDGHHDSKPFGPSSVGLDILFPSSKHVYGIPEHATSFALKSTTGNNAHYQEPYRLYNLDVCEFELDETMALYGSIPFMMSHTSEQTVGAWWFNPTELFVDVEDTEGGKKTHWMSESGLIDLWVLPGPKPLDVWSSYGRLTGTTALPPIFSLGYHQCRWNYKDQRDVAQVHAKFEELDFPYDVLWLDIEHTDGKRYFTWDNRVFPEPIKMQDELAAMGRKMVTIVDPHIKRDNNYHVHKEATAKGLYVKNKEGGDFDGWCWPGSSSYLDFTASHVRDWWAEQFSLDKYKGSTFNLYTWNDMNEPSVFNGPEVSMPKDSKNLEGIEHRQWHNVWGMMMQRATGEGQIKRHKDQNERPFVLSRAFFSGTQKYGAIWTGDNEASWAHLKSAAPMLLSINVAGLHFAGADVGGFFKNTESELMVRWMQAGAFQPFFRGHAHHDTDRKEPWVYGEPTTNQIKKAVALRYTFLPFWYTTFYLSHATGQPIMKPLWASYTNEEETFDMEDQWLVGNDLLVKPITDPGVTSTSVYFPGDQPWFDIITHQEIQGPGRLDNVNAPLDKIPVYQRGGSIIPRKMRLRRSSAMMTWDPYTIVIALDKTSNAEGYLYVDDEHTFDHLSGSYQLRKLSFSDGLFKNTESGRNNADFAVENEIERIVVVGFDGLLGKVEVLNPDGTSSRELSHKIDPITKVITVRKPNLHVSDEWIIAFRK